MNKSALKTFATNARRELLKKVEARSMKIGITEDNIKKADIESSDAIFIDGRQLSKEEKVQRDKLIDRIRQIGFKQVMEEVAYTWFNRFTALRFMEVNDYLPTKVRVLSSTNAGSTEPDMMKDALTLDLDLDKEYIYELKMNNSSEELFKYLIIKHCNDLNSYMPFMFKTIDDYTEILFPEGLLATDSFLRYMTNAEVIPEDNWKEIEIIGWLYQYYIAEEKEQVFANLKKNIKITKDTLPAATQLFTPNWIVRYMVENSLGRIWLESYPESRLRTEWSYYLDEAEQEEAVIKQLEELRYKNVNPEEITFLDPCCGSGHILVYAFDVFYEMYLEKGYIESEIPQLILEKNLYGLDIDDRAAQLASFAVMMKARGKSRRVFRKAIQPNIQSIQESNWLTDEMIENVSGNDNEAKEILMTIRDTFLDAKEYGSILRVKTLNYTHLEHHLKDYTEKQFDLFEMIDKYKVEEKLPGLINQSLILNKHYDVVCTNPPYMSRSGMNNKLSNFVKKTYPNSKSDLFAVFFEKGFGFLKEQGFLSMITMESWMFLSSFSNLREDLLNSKTITNMVHMPYLGKGGTSLGINFGTSAVVFSNKKIDNYLAQFNYIRYYETDKDGIPLQFPTVNERYKQTKLESLQRIPGMPIAYWVSDNFGKNYGNKMTLNDVIQIKQGLATGNNDYHLKIWYEINYNEIGFGYKSTKSFHNSNKKYAPYNKGGEFRKWYGNGEYVIKFNESNYNVLLTVGNHLPSRDYYFKDGITWTLVSTRSSFGARISNQGYVFDVGGSSGFTENNLNNFLGFLCSNVAYKYLEVLNPTINVQVGDLKNLPYNEKIVANNRIDQLVSENIAISKADWDSFETSWDFQKSPLLQVKTGKGKLEDSFNYWKCSKEKDFQKLKENEEELNSIFINIYNFQGEMTPEVEEKDVTIRKANLQHDIKNFLSYSIGCMFGRYSLDEDGIVFAGGKFDPSRYKTFSADKDNILPILQGAYIEDDIVSRFVDFVRITFGEDTLNENLDFVANALGRKKGETAKETLRQYFLNDFYKDHLKTYSKRPIYWLFTSGKEKAFNCLIYMHRYDKTTLSRIRTDYLHEYQIRLDAEKKDLINIIEGDSTAKEISNAKKELKSLDKKIEELKAYDELLHHMADMQIEIDLDDGVKVNYEKFKGLVAKI
ncbi:BREX-1 system adenine-specific DNA-methyltransferase PglX [Bacillus subtilis]